MGTEEGGHQTAGGRLRSETQRKQGTNIIYFRENGNFVRDVISQISQIVH